MPTGTRRSFVACLSIACVALSITACSDSDETRLARALRIPALPVATTVQTCGPTVRDGFPMWDCTVTTTRDDLAILTSGHTFTDLRAAAPDHVLLAKPSGYAEADHVHIVFHEVTGRAAIAIHTP